MLPTTSVQAPLVCLKEMSCKPRQRCTMPGNSLIRQSNTLLLPGMAGWHLGLLAMYFLSLYCFLLCTTFICGKNLGARFQLRLSLQDVQPLPLGACVRWCSLAIRWLLLHGMLACQATSWTSGEHSGLESSPHVLIAYETNVQNRTRREILIGKEMESSCWTRLRTWSKSVKGTAAIRKLRIFQTSIFQLFDHDTFASNTFSANFMIKRITQNDSEPHHNFNPAVRNSQRQLGPLTGLKMESQIQDNLLSEWSLEATPDFEFETQLQLQFGGMPFSYYTQPVATGLIQADVQHNLPGVFQDPLMYANSGAGMFQDPMVPDSGFFMQGMTYYKPTLDSINPGATTTDFRTTSSPLSCSSSDSYDFSFNSPVALGGNEYGVSETILASYPSTDLTVALVMQDNDFITASTSLTQDVIPLAQQSQQTEGITTAAPPQQPPERIQQPQPPSTQTEKSNEISVTPPRSRTGRPRNPMREWRMKHRPEKCTECGEGFPFTSELKRHIKTRHPDEATPKYGLSIERFFCKLCPRSYKRRERLRRHEREKHAQSTDRRVSQAQAPESDEKPPALEEGRPALRRLCPRGN